MAAGARIGILEYGLGNVRSIQRGFTLGGSDAIISSSLPELEQCDKLVLPGVGAFQECRRKLDETFGEALLPLLARKPALGICVGMQLLCDLSLEFGSTPGLGLVAGRVTRIDAGPLPVPHVGWNRVHPVAGEDNRLFRDIPDPTFFYFTHSYACELAQPGEVSATFEYGGTRTASLQKGRLYGVQFHPEKSARTGAQLLQNFARLG